MADVYQILDWQTHFENAKSRTVGRCSFVCVPNKQHGEGVGFILDLEDGSMIYGIWNLILGACSQHMAYPEADPQIFREGWLTNTGRPDGKPWTTRSLAIRWRRPEPEIQRALEVLCCAEVGWIVKVSVSAEGYRAYTAVSLNGRELKRTNAHAAHASPTELGDTAAAGVDDSSNGTANDSTGKQDESPARSEAKSRITPEEIYQAYPRHVEKQAALKAIRNALTSLRKRPGMKAPEPWLLERTRAYRSARERAIAGDPRESTYTPYPQKWFNKGRYDDPDAEWSAGVEDPSAIARRAVQLAAGASNEQ